MERRKDNEKNVSALKNQKSPQVRIQSKNGHPGRPSGPCLAQGEGTQETDLLICRRDSRFFLLHRSGKHRTRVPGKRLPVKQTLKKGDGLKLKSEFDYVKANGKKYFSPYFIVLIASGSLPEEGRRKEEGAKPRFGVICSRKFDRRAVLRNRARRLVRESFRLLKGRIRPCAMVVIPRREISRVGTGEVMSDLEKILHRSRLLDTSPKSVSTSL